MLFFTIDIINNDLCMYTYMYMQKKSPKHMCFLLLHINFQLNLTLKDAKAALDTYVLNGEWHLLGRELCAG